jgi:broad specificity phosphatase PhoE
VRIFVLARHAQSMLNIEHRVNGDPSVDVPLTELGGEEARRLGLEVAHLPLDVGVHTRFPRTRRTLELALGRRDVPQVEEPLLDDIYLGDLEGKTVDDYRAWKEEHTRADRFPGGESLDEAALRYARGYRRLLELSGEAVLVVCHEIPIRYALNAAAGSDELDGPAHALPNATPFLFDEAALERAAERVEKLTATLRSTPS